MACNVLKILKEHSIRPTNKLGHIVNTFENKDSSINDKVNAIQDAIQETLNSRNTYISKLELTPSRINKIRLSVDVVPLSNKDADRIIKHSKTATTTVMEDTIEVGNNATTKYSLSKFISNSKRKLNAFFQKSYTLVEYLATTEGTEAISEANKNDKTLIEEIQKISTGLTKMFYGENRKDALLKYMHKRTNAHEFAIKRNAASQTDMLKYLLKEDAKGNYSIDPLVLEAVAISVFNWLATGAMDAYFNTDPQINSIIGKNTNDKVNKYVQEELQYAGTVQAEIIDKIGSEVFKSLGFSAKPDVNGTLAPRLKLSLGNLALTYMLESDIVNQYKVPGNVFNNVDISKEGKEDISIFLQIKDRELVDKLTNAYKETNILPSLLKLDSYKKFPLFKATTSVPTKQRRSRANVPETTADTVRKIQSDEWVIRSHIADKVFSYSENLTNFIFGKKENIEKEHVMLRGSLISSNEKITRMVSNFHEFTSKFKNITDSFYLKYFVARNNRIHVDNNTIDPMNDKNIMRLVGLKNNEVLITKEDKDLRNTFKMAIAQGFGFKIDAKKPGQAYAFFNKIIINHKATIDAIRNNDTSPEAEALIRASIEAGKEGIHTFDALVALTNYSTSAAFRTDIGIETDAITSGVAIGNMISLLDGYEDLKSIGVFIDGTTKSSPDWRSNENNLDLYEKLAIKWMEQLKTTITDKNKDAVESLQSMLGKVLDERGAVTPLGRNLSKYPLMLTNYGAGKTKIIDAFVQDALDDMYIALAKADNITDAKERENAVTVLLLHLNNIIGTNFKYDATKDYKTTTLTGRDLHVFTALVKETYGESLHLALKDRLSGFITYRERVNESFQYMFYAFKEKFTIEVNKKEGKLGRILSINEAEALMDSLIEYMPVVKGPLSEGLEDGINVLKASLVRSYTEPYKAQQQYTRGIKNTVNNSASVGTYAKKYKPKDPGISGAVQSIHSIDSAIQQAMLSTFSALGIHDAGLYSLLDVDEGTLTYNESFFEKVTTYNLLDEINTRLQTVRALVAGDVNLNNLVTEATKLNMLSNNVNDKGKPLPFDVLHLETQLRDLLNEVNTKRKAFLADNKVIRVNNAAHIAPTVYVHDTTKAKDLRFTSAEAAEFVGDIFEATKKNSSSRSVDFDNFQAIYSDTVTAENLQTIYDLLLTLQLGNKTDSDTHQARLQSVLDKFIKLQKGIDLKVGKSKKGTFGAQRNFSDGTQDIHLLGSVSNIKANNELSVQETFVHELVHAVTAHAIDTNLKARNTIKRLFTQAKAHFTWKDFLNDKDNFTEVEKATAKEQYNYIFNNTQRDNNPYLHEFVAYALTNDNFAKKLATIVVREAKTSPSNLYERIVQWFNTALEIIANKVLGIQSTEHIDTALRKVLDQMLSTSEKRKSLLMKFHEALDRLNENTLSVLTGKVLLPISQFARNKNPTHVLGRTLRSMALILDYKTFKELGSVLGEVSFRMRLTEKHFITKLVREMQGLTKNNAIWHSLLRISKKEVDQLRLQITDNVIDQVQKGFHTKPTEAEGEAIYKAFMKTDLAALLLTSEKDKYTPEDIINLLSDDKILQTFIAEVEKQLLSNEFGNNGFYYVNQARGLGSLMATGTGFNVEQMKNAYNIASLNNAELRPIGDLHKAEQLIDELSTLHSISNTSFVYRKTAAEVYRSENAVDGLKNGITKLLYLHNFNKEESLKHLFSNQKALTEKGYTKETYDPNIDVVVGTKAEGETLKEEGYVRYGKALPKDVNDISTSTRYLYVNENSGNSSWVKSIVSLTSRQSKGTSLVDIFTSIQENTNYRDALTAIRKVKTANKADLQKQYTQLIEPNNNVTLLPIVNEEVRTVSYRYVMGEEAKDAILNRDNRFDYAMGRMYGSIADKRNSLDINRQVAITLKQDMDNNFLAAPDKYVDITSTNDKEYMEIYKLIPTEMKDDLEELFGTNKPVYIKKEFINLIFGFRKLRAKDADNFIGSAVRGVNTSLDYILRHLMIAENPKADIGKIWGGFVDIAKDNIVVKTGVILLPNFISNNIILFVKGVPLSKIASYQAEALLELTKYHNDKSRRDIVARTLSSDKSLTKRQRKKLEVELGTLEYDLKHNAVKELVDEGIFQSIIEDIEVEEDIYSGKAKLKDKISSFADKYLNEFATTTYKHIYMTRDTKPYQVLLKATQVSDFMARYALYKHRMVNIPKSLTSDDERKSYKANTLNEIVETFINYDIPTSRELQWVNDVGMLMFTKFYFRIQKIIFKMFVPDSDKVDPANPSGPRIASAMSVYLVEDLFGNMDEITDVSLFHFGILDRANTPFDIIDYATDIPAFELLTG